MDLEQSALYREIIAIQQDGGNPVHFSWEAMIHPVALQGYVAPLKIVNIDIDRDYDGQYSDHIMLKLLIAGGDYMKYVYPYQGNLEITLIRRPLAEVGTNADVTQSVQQERYMAQIVDNGDLSIQGAVHGTASATNFDLSTPVEAYFQLVNKSVEQMRMISVGGIYRQCTAEAVLKTVLTNANNAVQVDAIRRIKGVDMVPMVNQTPRTHIVIPQGVKLPDLGTYLQEHCGGIYGSGLGIYQQGDYWYVYPKFDPTRFNNPGKTLTVINVPANRFPQVERTFRTNGDALIVMATGNIQFRDSSDPRQLTLGNGVRFADANKFMDGSALTVKDNVVIANRASLNNEFITTPRENGYNYVTSAGNRTTANPLAEMSRMAERDGGVMAFNWENSDPSLIIPGMPCHVLYLVDDAIQELWGTVLKSQSYVQLDGQGMNTTRYKQNTVLSLFVRRTLK